MWRRSTSRSRTRTSASKSTSRKASGRRARSSTTRNSWRFSPCRSPPRSPGCERGKSPTRKPCRASSGRRRSSAGSGARVPENSEPISEFDPAFAGPVCGFETPDRNAFHDAGELHVGVLDAPVMHKSAERQVILFDHQGGAVAVAVALRVGHIVQAGDIRIAELGLLFSLYEDVRFDGRSENPAGLDTDACSQSYGQIEIVRITPIACEYLPTALGIASRVVIEIAIPETEVGRQRDAAPRGKVHAGDAARLDDQVGHGILGARALVLERAVGFAAVDPEKHAIPTRRERVRADNASSGADEFGEVRFFVVIVRELYANLEPTPGGEGIGLRRRLGDRRGGDRKENRRACQDFFQGATPFHVYLRGLTRFRYSAMCRMACLGLPSALHSSPRL